MRLFCFVFCLLLSSFALQGCATSYGRQNDPVRVYFKTNAPQATVNCGGEATELPGNILLRRGSNHDCWAQAPGFEKLNFRVWSKISGEGFKYSTKMNWQKWSKWTLGIGNLVAWPIDFFSGSMKSLENDHYDLKMYSSASVSIASKAFEKTSTLTRKIVSMPADVVEETTGTVLNGVVKAPAEALGLSSDAQRKETENKLEGHAAEERLAAN
jgi:hypothetical protein